MRWVKGQSGNANGRPKDNVDGYNLPAMCRLRTPDCVRLWGEVLDDPSAPLRDRMRAAELLMDRAYGKPMQQAQIAVAHDARDAKSLTDDELAAIIASHSPTIASPTRC